MSFLSVATETIVAMQYIENKCVTWLLDGMNKGRCFYMSVLDSGIVTLVTF